MNINQTKFKTSDFTKAKIHTKLTPGEALSKLRHLQGLSQFQLAKLAGLSQPNISAIENGRSSMGRETALTLAYALKVHQVYFYFLISI